MSETTGRPRFSLKNHIAYNGWKYVLLIALSIFGWSLVFTMTEYRSPPELTVSVYFMSEYLPDEQLSAIKERITPYLPGMEKIDFISSMASSDEYNLQQYLMVMMGAGEGDVFIVNEELFYQIAQQGGAQPLDDYIAEGVIRPGDIDFSGVTFPVYETDKDYNPIIDPSVPEHIYGLPLGTLYGFIIEDYFDIRHQYAIIMSYSQNPDNAAKLLQAFIDEKSAPRPEWLDEWEQGERDEGAAQE